MNYIDRKSIGLERFFAQRSDTLTHLDEFSEQDLSERLSLLSLYTRLHLAFVIRRALKDLRKYPGLCVDELIPERVFALDSMSPFELCRPEKMIIFLGWLRRLNIRNEQGRVAWLSALKSAAARFAPDCGSFIRASFTLSNQRVFIKSDKDRITLSLAERDWGRVSVCFDDCSLESAAGFPLPGYAVACEAEVRGDNRTYFRFLIDPYFGEHDFIERLLSDDGWQTLTFTCGDVSLDAVCVDYVGNLSKCGIPKADLIENVCRILLNKRLLLGSDALTSGERSMMPVISLLCGLDGFNSSELAAWQCEDIIIEALDNRYAMENFCRMLCETGCDDLATIIEKAKDDNSNQAALSHAKLFAALLDRKITDGSARPLLHRLYRQFTEMSAQNTGRTARMSATHTALDRICGNISPAMTKMGYTGHFPHFQRRKKQCTEYISFILDPASDRLHKGVMSYTASVAAAEIDAKRISSMEQAGIDITETTALDCLAEAFDSAHYGELHSSNSADLPKIDVYVYSDNASVINDSTSTLSEQLACAEQQFSLGHLTAASKRCVEKSNLFFSFGRSFLFWLPLTVLLAAAALVVYMLLGADALGISRNSALLLTLSNGIVLNSLLAIARMIFCSFKIWRY